MISAAQPALAHTKPIDELHASIQASAAHFNTQNVVPLALRYLIETAMTMGAVMGIQHTIARYSRNSHQPIQHKESL